MLAEAARGAFLDWLGQERRASPLTVEAYGADIAAFLGFLTQHLGGEPDLAALAALRPADFRAWLAAQAGEGAPTPPAPDTWPRCAPSSVGWRAGRAWTTPRSS